jgi:hypothetical protein
MKVQKSLDPKSTGDRGDGQLPVYVPPQDHHLHQRRASRADRAGAHLFSFALRDAAVFAQRQASEKIMTGKGWKKQDFIKHQN